MKRTTHLKAHPFCQCHVNVDNNKIDFISYTTRVITIINEGGKRLIECTGIYSPTTARQITYFLREFAPDLRLADMKKIVGGVALWFAKYKTEKVYIKGGKYKTAEESLKIKTKCL